MATIPLEGRSNPAAHDPLALLARPETRPEINPGGHFEQHLRRSEPQPAGPSEPPERSAHPGPVERSSSQEEDRAEENCRHDATSENAESSCSETGKVAKPDPSSPPGEPPPEDPSAEQDPLAAAAQAALTAGAQKPLPGSLDPLPEELEAEGSGELPDAPTGPRQKGNRHLPTAAEARELAAEPSHEDGGPPTSQLAKRADGSETAPQERALGASADSLDGSPAAPDIRESGTARASRSEVARAGSGTESFPAALSQESASVEPAAILPTLPEGSTREGESSARPGGETLGTRAAGEGAPPPTGRSPQHLLARLSEQSPGPQSLSEADQARFVQRVARAMQSSASQEGELRLRLSPPELGSLRLEVKVLSGVMSARIETESPAARALLLENLPALRERLAEQNIRLEQFDIDLMNRQGGEHPGHAPGGHGHEAPPAETAVRGVKGAEPESEPAAGRAAWPRANGALDVLI